MKIFNIKKYLLFIAVAVILSSCLTVEKKIYTFQFTDANSGKLTIKYINILSMKEDSAFALEDDLYVLVNDYLAGQRIENDFPLAYNFQKKLYEENGQLCGEVSMEFKNLQAVNLFKYNKKTPIMFSLSSSFDNEEFISSNGLYGGSKMPVVFWENKLKVLNLETKVNAPDSNTVSLLETYNAFK